MCNKVEDWIKISQFLKNNKDEIDDHVTITKEEHDKLLTHEKSIDNILKLHQELNGTCTECSRIVALGSPNNEGIILYPCLTIAQVGW